MSSRLYVGRLSHQAQEKEVERFFKGFGRIKDINLKNGFGFVVRCVVWVCKYAVCGQVAGEPAASTSGRKTSLAHPTRTAHTLSQARYT